MRIVHFVVAALAASLAANARAGVIFDSHTGSPGSGFTSADAGGGTRVTVGANVTITNISVLNRMSTAGDLKFVIFDHTTHTLQLATAATSFAADPTTSPTWKTSPSFSFTLLGGNEYDIGAIGNVSRTDWFDTVSESQNGITSVVGGPAFSGFASPSFTVHLTGKDLAVRLHGDMTAGAVPEPSSLLVWSIVVAGAAVGAARRRRTRM